jgi:hypothetical protein
MDISKLKVVELRKLAKDKNLKGYSKLRKQELISFILQKIKNVQKIEKVKKKVEKKVEKNECLQTFTLTFGNRAENHRGMQMIGKELENGLSLEDLDKAKKFFESKGCKPIEIDLNEYLGVDGAEKARILIVPNGVSYLVDVNELYKEIEGTKKDTKAFMYGRVVNKKARHNNCFSDFSQEPVYEEGKGTVIDFVDVPILKKIREKLPEIIPGNENLKSLQCEGNYYYDTKKTFIGFHGDSEREIVIAARLGSAFNIYYQWFYKSKAVGKLFEYKLNHGDMYFMSEKAVGKDWKTKNKYTLRHAAANDFSLIKK